MIKYKCPKCGTTLESESSMAGREDLCPLCRTVCSVPAPRKVNRRALLAVGAGGAAVVAAAAVVLVVLHLGSGSPAPTERSSPKASAALPAAPPAVAVIEQSVERTATPEPPVPSESTPLSPEQLFERASPAVVYIVVRDKEFKQLGLGSGFFMDAKGLIVTNYHVIKGAEFATARLSTGATVFVDGVVATDPDADLALLKVSGGAPAFLKTAGGALPKVGSAVYAIGNPRGLENTFSGGMVSGHRELKPGMTAIQVTTPISPGSSGGPLLNAGGEVVGVTTAYLTGGQNLNFAVPSAAVHRLIQSQGKVQTLASAGGGPLDKEQTDQLDQAWEAMKQKDWAKAARLLTALRDSQKDNPSVWFALAYLHGELGSHDLAVACNKMAIDLRPDFISAYFNMAIAYREMKRYPEAIAAYKAAIAIKPDYADAYRQIGLAYRRMEQNPEAIAAYKAAIAIKPDDADAQLLMGIAYDEMKRYPEAIAAYKAAIAIKPDDADSQSAIGGIYLFELKKYPEAIAAYRAAIAIKPDFADAHYFIGCAYQEMQRYPEAIAAYKAAIAIKPDDADAYYSMGRSYEQLGQRAAALAAYQESIRLAPTGGFADLVRKGIRRLGGQVGATGRPQPTAGPKAGTADPVDTETDAQKGMRVYEMYRRAGLTDKALDCLRSLLEDRPSTEAIEAYKKATKPENVSWHLIGRAYEQLGQRDNAFAAYKQAVSIDPRMGFVYIHMGGRYENLGQRADALAAYQEYLRVQPTGGYADDARDGIRRLGGQ